MVIDFKEKGASVVVEVEDSFCYSYYLSNDIITGDVWLFNIGETPDAAPWKGGGKPPFQNSNEYCYPHSISLPIFEEEFRVLFNPTSKAAGIYFRGKLVGILKPDSRPGKSAFAKADSPVAHKMDQPVPLPT